MTEPTEAMIEAGAGEFPANGFGIDRTFLARSYLTMKALDSDTHRAAPTDAVEAVTQAIRIRALETADMDESEQWFAEQFARAALAALAAMSAPKEPSQ